MFFKVAIYYLRNVSKIDKYLNNKSLKINY